MIPFLNANGLLPVGIHIADFDEVAATFGSNAQRRQLLLNLKQWAASELRPVSDCVEAIIISGSFVTNKPTPADIDCTVIVDTQSAAGISLRDTLRRDSVQIWKAYGVDVLPNAGVFLQFVGDKSARRHNCCATDLRGVVSITSWHRNTEQMQMLSMHAAMMSA